MVFGPLSTISGDETNTPLELIAMIDNGMSGKCLNKLQARVPVDLLSQLLDCSENDLSSLFSKRLNKLQTGNAYDFSLLWYELREFFNDDHSLMREWIFTPNPAFSGEYPRNLMATIEGRKLIRKCIGLMQSGDFS
tara:strand:- start:281 stop:688 length:408 start_codon:yes stop_codon:yes gene_type:complete